MIEKSKELWQTVTIYLQAVYSFHNDQTVRIPLCTSYIHTSFMVVKKMIVDTHAHTHTHIQTYIHTDLFMTIIRKSSQSSIFNCDPKTRTDKFVSNSHTYIEQNPIIIQITP